MKVECPSFTSIISPWLVFFTVLWDIRGMPWWKPSPMTFSCIFPNTVCNSNEEEIYYESKSFVYLGL